MKKKLTKQKNSEHNELREKIRIEYAINNLKRLQRIRKPIQEELDQIDDQIKKQEEKLNQLKADSKITFF